MIRTVRAVALLAALAFGAVAGPVGATATTSDHPALRTSTTSPSSNPSIIAVLLDGVLAPLAPVVNAVLDGFDEAFTVGGKTLIRLFVPKN